MLTRDQLKQTEQWQALNAIWKELTPQQRQVVTPQIQLLSAFIQQTLEPPKDYTAEDTAYKDELSNDAAAFALYLERSGLNLYQLFSQLIAKSTFESADKLMIFFDLKYKSRYDWVTENRDEVLEVLELAWRRQVERGFVAGEGFPAAH